MKSLTGIATNKHAEQDNRGLRQLQARVIYLFGDVATIERLGLFLLDCAKEMGDNSPFHRHFKDFHRGWQPAFLDVVVERSVNKTSRRNTSQKSAPIELARPPRGSRRMRRGALSGRQTA
jgi:hypothetical protein